ncbi:uncharacterized protein N7477_004285 [Penicillium maclennaniae]|uniref:uncharacterized protein n=1 Tax=Penicillium maclennaniae TaxID=1343394 RepID=UPI00254066A3|nr:uncharacterized protein N7477_004285 [Penicillium maclennaniae]KAJ5674351.1 hypothetical protein N7477_004285 [Penicillium maclennaniae]
MTLTKWHNHWPGGIPSFIRRHEEPVENVATASLGDGAAVDEQRRALIERWATADQEFRDSYESRAPEDERIFENPEDPTKYFPVEDNQGDILDIFKFRQSVARPDFLDMYMTVNGTVLFTECEPKLIIDDYTLETGLCLWVQFENNGTRERAWRAQMVMEEFPDHFRDVHLNMNSLDSVLTYLEEDEDPHPEEILEDEPVDMRRPLMEIYPRDRSKQLDRYAPGFREAEDAGNGLPIGYDLERIIADDGGPLRIIED